MNENLQTERTILRHWRESDAESLYKYASDPQVGPAAGWPPHTSVENSREIIRDILSAKGTYAVVLKESNEVVGCVGLIFEKRTAQMGDNEGEIGYWLGVPYWGKGLIPEVVREMMRYAFEVIGWDALWCGYYDGNEKSRRVQEKCGFTFHHTEKDMQVELLNERRTQHFTRITRNDWLQKSII